MSRIRANSITDVTGTAAPTFPNGANVTGIITATSFSGPLAGNATGLIGSPSITVSGVTNTGNATVGGALTVTGNLTVNGTQTIINTQSLDVTDKTIGIGSTSSPTDSLADGSGIIVYGTTNKTLTYNNTKKAFETNIPWSPNESRFVTGAEKVTIVSGNTANLVYSTNSSNIAICTNPTGNITLNVTGIPVTSDFDSSSVTFAVLSNASAGTAYSCLTVTLNGLTPTIRWAGGSSQAATAGVTTTSGYTIYTFSGINTVGSASTTANYLVLGTVSGGYF